MPKNYLDTKETITKLKQIEEMVIRMIKREYRYEYERKRVVNLLKLLDKSISKVLANVADTILECSYFEKYHADWKEVQERYSKIQRLVKVCVKRARQDELEEEFYDKTLKIVRKFIKLQREFFESNEKKIQEMMLDFFCDSTPGRKTGIEGYLRNEVKKDFDLRKRLARKLIKQIKKVDEMETLTSLLSRSQIMYSSLTKSGGSYWDVMIKSKPYVRAVEKALDNIISEFEKAIKDMEERAKRYLKTPRDMSNQKVKAFAEKNSGDDDAIQKFARQSKSRERERLKEKAETYLFNFYDKQVGSSVDSEASIKYKLNAEWAGAFFIKDIGKTRRAKLKQLADRLVAVSPPTFMRWEQGLAKYQEKYGKRLE